MAVLVAISDLFFASKIDAVIASAGAAATRAKRGEDLVEQVRRAMPKRVLVELGSTSYGLPAIDAIRAIKADASLAGVELVGYCGHTKTELIRAAKRAGVDRVLTQGELAELLPRVLDESAELPKGAAHCD